MKGYFIDTSLKSQVKLTEAEKVTTCYLLKSAKNSTNITTFCRLELTARLSCCNVVLNVFYPYIIVNIRYKVTNLKTSTLTAIMATSQKCIGTTNASCIWWTLLTVVLSKRLSYQEVFSIGICPVSSLGGQKLKVELKARVGVHRNTALRDQELISAKHVFQNHIHFPA